MNIRDLIQAFSWGSFHITTRVKVRLPGGKKVHARRITEEDGEAVIETEE